METEVATFAGPRGDFDSLTINLNEQCETKRQNFNIFGKKTPLVGIGLWQKSSARVRLFCAISGGRSFLGCLS